MVECAYILPFFFLEGGSMNTLNNVLDLFIIIQLVFSFSRFILIECSTHRAKQFFSRITGSEIVITEVVKFIIISLFYNISTDFSVFLYVTLGIFIMSIYLGTWYCIYRIWEEYKKKDL